MPRLIATIAWMMLMISYPTATAWSQQFGGGGGFGGAGGGGGFGGGGGGFGGGGLGGGGFGGGLGSTGMGGGGFGGGGFGGGGLGGGGFGGGMGGGGLGSTGFSGGSFGAGGLGGAGTGTAGVYTQSLPMQSMFQGGAQGQANFLNQFAQQRTAGQMQQRNQTQTQTSGTNTRPPVRVRLNVAFDPVASSSATDNSPSAARNLGLAGVSVDTRLEGLLERRGVANAQVDMEGRTAILRGSVSDSDERRMVERIASLEPGVSAIRNEIEVAEELSTPQ